MPAFLTRRSILSKRLELGVVLKLVKYTFDVCIVSIDEFITHKISAIFRLTVLFLLFL